jgi:hypothetical protein
MEASESVQKVAQEHLYQAGRHLSAEDRKRLGLRFPAPVYVQDPEVAKRNPQLGIHDLWLEWEPGLMDGPTSARVAVVDYNADSGTLIPPARWDEERRRFTGADDPDSFQFHQVNVWAVVQNALSFFEDPHVMGRPVPWGFEGNRILLVPHAGFMRNAYYDRRSKSLQFYFFGDQERPVYTCLSHDIIAHETGHAILDGIRPYYHEISSPQTSAFHEFLADLTAILATLRNNDVRRVIAEKSGGDLTKDEVIADLAEEFARDEVLDTYGEAQRYYLRTAHNDMTMEDIEGKWEPHECSQVLTGAMFDILARMAILYLEEMSPAQALWRATDHFNRIALRALDYCPSVDVQFIDYAQAALRADELAYPMDKKGYRDVMREVFQKRGLEIQSNPSPPHNVEFLWRYGIDDISRSRTAAYLFLNDNRSTLRIPPQQDLIVADLYTTDKVVEAEKRLPSEIVLEYVWMEDVVLMGDRFGRFKNQVLPLLCGGTLVFDGRGNLLHWDSKPGVEGQTGERRQEGERRRGVLLDYVQNLIDAGMLGLVDDESLQTVDVTPIPVLGTRREGGLQLEMTSSLMHGLNRGGPSHG